ncbi:MAG TPA: choice-of-anchor Q domain-containing protein, partial [Anaerolineae bacterium]|nr:choice-of-anchor Q domain-containing protein [Anaerolineae bacterium]
TAILNTIISGNTANSACGLDCAGGGGVFNQGGYVSLSDMSVIGNASLGGIGNVGGGLFNLNGGVMEIKNVDLNRNTSNESGGGAFNGYGSYMEMSVDRVMTNTVAQYGGGVVNSGTLVIDNSIFAGNVVTADAIFVGGGAIQNFGILTVTASTIASNTARLGGGIQNDAVAVLALINSSISYNSATNYAGLSLSGQVSVLNSTIDHNTSLGNGAGINNRGNLALTNSTISSNRISFGGWGAGLDNQSGMAQLINVSVISNTSTIGGAGFHTLGALYLTNTLLAGNVWMSSAQANCGGTTYTSRGYNLSSDATCTLLNATGDMTNVNPHIGPLANNGGSTWTHALRVGSPAIDRGTNAGCPSTDQRGIARPQLVKCDIGAYEYDGVLKIVFLPLTLKNY